MAKSDRHDFEALKGLTNRWSQPLAAAMRTDDFMKRSSVFATLAAAIGGSAASRYRPELPAFLRRSRTGNLARSQGGETPSTN